MLKEISLTPSQTLIKRMLDVILSLVFLIILAPSMLAITIAIKLSDPGPTIYKTRRLTPEGKNVFILKFRTMVTSEDGPIIAQSVKNDPRVTKLGSFLRRTGLDEIPTFLNVLAGNMSVVGPRPKHEFEYEHYRNIRNVIVKVKPGITFTARAYGYTSSYQELSAIEHLHQLEIDYVQNWSIWLDLKIILLTINKGFFSSAAY